MSTSAQLSPGKLGKAHANVEGLSNCTQCHDIGNKVPDQKCLACHNEISALIEDQHGFHTSKDVVEKPCIDCHSDHHGRTFDLVRFDQKTFDHPLTGYTLKGQHDQVECRACHQPKNISDPELARRENTFLGLVDDCLSCHADFHQGTLSQTCIDCHDFNSFRPASEFDHANTNFSLEGAHVDVECIACHPMESRLGVEFQVFSELSFADCIDCHDDVHKNHFTSQCTQCHSVNSFNQFMGQERFDHSTTAFELKGQHQSTACFACHEEELNAVEIFQDKIGILFTNCVACHDDVHDNKFGTNCTECHQETSFFDLKNMNLFNHDVTDFPLVGLHVGVDCKSCHESTYTDEIDFALCRNCHDDYHQGDFIQEGIARDCDACHQLENPFTYTTYGFDEHLVSTFPLEGSHLATPCFACHMDEDRWMFKAIGHDCIDCHEDTHIGFISSTYYLNQSCTTCHGTESWQEVSFDHATTDWPLAGRHAEVACRACHFESVGPSEPASQQFSDLGQTCAACHDNPHGTQFEQNGSTHCVRGHTVYDWNPTNFDHDQTSFPLDGKHLETDCRACHSTTIDNNGEKQSVFQMTSFECVDCHG